MQKLNSPAIDEAEYFRQFASHRKKAARALLVGPMESRILNAYGGYEGRIRDGSFSPMPLTHKEAVVLFNNYRLTGAEKAMSHLRDQIMFSATRGRCPYCDTGQVATLDHYLPKKRFPEFAVLSANLIPACFRCNNARGTALVSDGNRIWHAYLDEVPDEPILFAEVKSTAGTQVIKFSMRNPEGVDAAVYARLKYLFRALKLKRFYETEADVELFDLAPSCTRIYDDAGSAAVKEYVTQLADDYLRLYGRNHWRTALFVGLSGVADFSAPGFDGFVRQDIDQL